MKKILFFIIILAFYGCNKPKTVFICGDHVCINKSEAQHYFENNLSLEVKLIDKKKAKTIDLVELNLKSNSEGKKEVTVLQKSQTNKKLKILSNDEIKRKKAELKKIKKIKDEKINQEAKLKKPKEKQKSVNNIIKTKKIVNKSSKRITDICTVLEKCSIDEISKYLVKQGKNKKFPDITIRENK